MHAQLFQLTLIFFLGAFCQWFAWKLKLPAILLLLLTGIAVGPLAGLINPNVLFGDLLFPLVSLSVAIILYQGGLDLDLKELVGTRRIIFSLISIGCLVNWLIISSVAFYVLDFSLELSCLLAAILTVSGPTVVQPLLRFIKPREPVYSILKWEGILIDPIGALLAVLVLEHMLISDQSASIGLIFLTLLGTMAVGYVVGYIFAKIFVGITKYSALPKELYNTFSLALLFSSFYIANIAFAEAGLVAVTVMGIIVGNDSHPAVKHVISFQENLRVLLVSALFIVLAARVDWAIFETIGLEECLFVATIIFIARPLMVFISTFKTEISFKDRLFLSAMYPRGIVAAAVSSFFALKLDNAGIAGGNELVTLVFLVIVTTVIFYALTGNLFAGILDVKVPEAWRCLIVGINKFTIDYAKLLKDQGLEVTLVDTNKFKVKQAKKSGLKALEANLLNAEELEKLDLDSIKHVYVLTSNAEINILLALKLKNIFGSKAVSLFRNEKSAFFNLELEDNLISEFEFSAELYEIEDETKEYSISAIKIDDLTIVDSLKSEYADFLSIAIIRNGSLFQTNNKLYSKIIAGDVLIYLGSKGG
jgi:NhaP-type Na+/H+ or K+/H+ antiporter